MHFTMIWEEEYTRNKVNENVSRHFQSENHNLLKFLWFCVSRLVCQMALGFVQALHNPLHQG